MEETQRAKAPKIVEKWNSKSAVVPSNKPVELNDTEFTNGDYTVRFEASLNRVGYDILIQRR